MQGETPRMCAARTFHDLLVLKNAGFVQMAQARAFGELRVRERSGA